MIERQTASLRLEERSTAALEGPFPLAKKVLELGVSSYLNFREDGSGISQSKFFLSTKQKYSEQSLMSGAVLLIFAGDYGLARELLSEVLLSDPFNEMALRQFAITFEKQGDDLSACRCLITLSNYHTNFDNLARLGHCLYRLGREDEALASYQMALRRLPRYSDALGDVYRNQGNILAKQGDFDGAEENYNRALVISPNCDILSVNYGALEIQRDHWEEAALRFRRALNENNKNEKAWVGLALVHRYHGDFELAWANLTQATEIAAGNSTAAQLAADWAMQDGQMEKAQRILQNYLAVHFDDVEISLLLVKIFLLQKKMDLAMLEMERALCLAPDQDTVVELYEEIRQKRIQG